MMKARFEEAKGKELTAAKTSTPQKTYQSGPPMPTSSSAGRTNKSSKKAPRTNTSTPLQ